MPIQSINPLNNQVIQTFEEHTGTYVQKALTQAEEAYHQGKQLSFEERAQRMHRVAELLRKNKSQYGQIMTDEMGKTRQQAIGEVEKCAMCCDYFADHAAQFLADEPLSVEEGEAYLAYDPIGAVLAIMPWNFPFWQVIRFAAPNLMAGNVGLLKHAPNVPQCALALESVFREAGFPSGAFQTLLIDHDRVEGLLEDDRIKAATLTGSDRAGSAVARKAGEQIKKTVLELGGSDPFIVLSDADVAQAAEVAVKARMQNCGQSCIAAKRFIVEASVANAFTEQLVKKMDALQQGDPNDDATDYGPMAREDLAETLLQQVQDSVSKGAKVLLGGDRPAREGAFFNATVLTDIPANAAAYREELFGPVASVFVVADAQEAIRLSNDSPYGLGSSLWTKDVDKAQQLARQIESGAVYINQMMASHPAVPFGGIKRSGYGRELSPLGIREFTNQKTVWVK